MSISSRHQAIQFRPSRVEGIADVTEVRIFRDRLELKSGDAWHSYRYLSFAQGREIQTGRVPVGELHFSKSNYPDSYFIFYTTPRVVIYMPADGPTGYPHSVFWRVQEMLRESGFKLYEDGPPAVPYWVLDSRPMRSIAYVLALLAFAWLLGLSGFLPGQVGEATRHFLLSNPDNPSIGVAFMIPASAIPLVLAFRHGNSKQAIVGVIALSYIVALSSEWALRGVIHPWAPLEQPPTNIAFWSVHQFRSLLIVVTVAAFVGASWRRRHLEPISAAERSGASAMN